MNRRTAYRLLSLWGLAAAIGGGRVLGFLVRRTLIKGVGRITRWP